MNYLATQDWGVLWEESFARVPTAVFVVLMLAIVLAWTVRLAILIMRTLGGKHRKYPKMKHRNQQGDKP